MKIKIQMCLNVFKISNISEDNVGGTKLKGISSGENHQLKAIRFQILSCNELSLPEKSKVK